MTERSDKVKQICDAHAADCKDCPLRTPCVMKVGDSLDTYAQRMNEAAEHLS